MNGKNIKSVTKIMIKSILIRSVESDYVSRRENVAIEVCMKKYIQSA